MILTTTNNIEGYRITRYIGVIAVEIITTAGFLKDWYAGVKDFLGGRVHDYENEVRKGRAKIMAKMREMAASEGANAVVGIRYAYEVLSPKGKGTVLLITVSGTAVYAVPEREGFFVSDKR